MKIGQQNFQIWLEIIFEGNNIWWYDKATLEQAITEVKSGRMLRIRCFKAIYNSKNDNNGRKGEKFKILGRSTILTPELEKNGR